MASMLERSVAALDQSGAQVSVALAQQAAHGQEVLGQLGSSAIELAALGEAFHHGVQLFSSSNERLVEALQRVETGMGQASARSDEQLAYYVAQAREVIDLSISSQRGIIEELRRLQSASVAPAEEAGA